MANDSDPSNSLSGIRGRKREREEILSLAVDIVMAILTKQRSTWGRRVAEIKIGDREKRTTCFAERLHVDWDIWGGLGKSVGGGGGKIGEGSIQVRYGNALRGVPSNRDRKHVLRRRAGLWDRVDTK